MASAAIMAIMAIMAVDIACIVDSSTGVGLSSSCDVFTLMAGLIFDGSVEGSDMTVDSISPLIRLAMSYVASTPADSSPNYFVSKYAPAMYALNRAAYVAQFAVSSNLTAAAWAQGSFDFCGFNCTMVSAMSSDIFTQAISPYYYQLGDGSCANPFNLSMW